MYAIIVISVDPDEPPEIVSVYMRKDLQSANGFAAQLADQLLKEGFDEEADPEILTSSEDYIVVGVLDGIAYHIHVWRVHND